MNQMLQFETIAGPAFVLRDDVVSIESREVVGMSEVKCLLKTTRGESFWSTEPAADIMQRLTNDPRGRKTLIREDFAGKEPWGSFLAARAHLIREFHDNYGKSFKEIANEASLKDAQHAERIYVGTK